MDPTAGRINAYILLNDLFTDKKRRGIILGFFLCVLLKTVAIVSDYERIASNRRMFG
jgi:hypothetical protein